MKQHKLRQRNTGLPRAVLRKPPRNALPGPAAGSRELPQLRNARDAQGRWARRPVLPSHPSNVSHQPQESLFSPSPLKDCGGFPCPAAPGASSGLLATNEDETLSLTSHTQSGIPFFLISSVFPVQRLPLAVAWLSPGAVILQHTSENRSLLLSYFGLTFLFIRSTLCTGTEHLHWEPTASIKCNYFSLRRAC